jgi:hypothetical protein
MAIIPGFMQMVGPFTKIIGFIRTKMQAGKQAAAQSTKDAATEATAEGVK